MIYCTTIMTMEIQLLLRAIGFAKA